MICNTLVAISLERRTFFNELHYAKSTLRIPRHDQTIHIGHQIIVTSVNHHTKYHIIPFDQASITGASSTKCLEQNKYT